MIILNVKVDSRSVCRLEKHSLPTFSQTELLQLKISIPKCVFFFPPK